MQQGRTTGGVTGASALDTVGKWGANTFLINLVLCCILLFSQPISHANMEGGEGTCAVFAPIAKIGSYGSAMFLSLQIRRQVLEPK